jgi:hypothetical protein
VLGVIVRKKTDATRAREETAKLGMEEAQARLARAIETGNQAVKKIAAKDADQYMLRLPPGLRDRVARRAEENGRSMNTEIVAAIEQYLTSADRVTQLWEFFGKHQENIEAIRWILPAIRLIEDYLGELRGALSEDYDPGSPPDVAHTWADRKRSDTGVASLPLITADQVEIVRALLKATGDDDEETFVAVLGAPRIEDIRGFERAMELLGRRIDWRLTPDQLETIKALLKGTGRSEEILALMGSGAHRRLG